MTPVQKLIGLGLAILLALAVGFGGAWQVQDWRMGKKLAEQAGLYKDDLARITMAAAAQVSTEQENRLAAEHRATKPHGQRQKDRAKDLPRRHHGTSLKKTW